MAILLVIIGLIVLGPVAVLTLLVLGINGVLGLGLVASVAGLLVALAMQSPGVALVSAAAGGACFWGLLPAPGQQPTKAAAKGEPQMPPTEPRQRGATPRKQSNQG